jgi:hypothetical protein
MLYGPWLIVLLLLSSLAAAFVATVLQLKIFVQSSNGTELSPDRRPRKKAKGVQYGAWLKSWVKIASEQLCQQSHLSKQNISEHGTRTPRSSFRGGRTRKRHFDPSICSQ